MRGRFFAVCLAVVACGVMVTGCASTDTVGGTTGQTTTEAAEAGGEWIVGSWTVQHELLTVDPEIMRAAADQSEATWSCTLEGETLKLTTSQHTYTGPFVVDGDSFTYDATSTYLDEAGESWTSVIKVDGTHAGDTAFTAEMWGEISSKSGGVLYTATWAQTGAKSAGK